MNTTGYILARLANSFGFHRKNKRLSDAAEEMHLLRQAEEILGEDTWEEVEQIEDVSVEYWTLRKQVMKRDELEHEIRQADGVLNTSHEERSNLLAQSNEACLEMEKKREELIKHTEQLVAERDSIISRAKAIRRKYDAAVTKITVIKTDSQNQDRVDAEKEKISEFKVQFSGLKAKRLEIGKKLEEIDNRILQVEETISHERKNLRQQASTAYQSIGKANRDVSRLTAQIGLIDEEMRVHFTEIGRHLSMHVGTDPDCANVCRSHGHLVAQMQSLRASIAFNHKLAAMAGA